MGFLPWVLLAVLAAVVVWVVMRQNNPLPPPASVNYNGQPNPIGTFTNPQAANSDAATVGAIASAVGAAFGLVTQLVKNGQK